MTQKIAVVVVGASGAMGRSLIKAVGETDDMSLIGATDAPGSPWIGKTLTEMLPDAPEGVTITDDPLPAFAKAQAILAVLHQFVW